MFYFLESDRVPGFGGTGSGLGSTTLGLQNMLSHHHFMGQHRSAPPPPPDASPLTAAAAAAAASLNPEAAKNFLMHTSHALSPPPTVELRPSKVNPKSSSLGVFAVETLSCGTRFGPFLGKWAFEPGNPHQAWEVRKHSYNS